jgi:hypothetical protein
VPLKIKTPNKLPATCLPDRQAFVDTKFLLLIPFVLIATNKAEL